MILFGGEGGIRTLDGLLTHTPLAGERLQPLGHLSGKISNQILQAGLYLKNMLSKRQVFILIPDNAPFSRVACPDP